MAVEIRLARLAKRGGSARDDDRFIDMTSSVIGQSSEGSDGRSTNGSGQAQAGPARRWAQRSRWALVFCVGLLAQGCPVYEDYCDSRADCAPGFRCNVYTGDCELASFGPGPACNAPRDCGPGETCAQSGECLPGSCVFHGCVSGYTCSVVDGLHTCAPRSQTGGPGATDAGEPSGEAADASSSDAAAADSTSDASSPADASLDATP
jgi:hypothetical protein